MITQPIAIEHDHLNSGDKQNVEYFVSIEHCVEKKRKQLRDFLVI